jgi:hypothetical protein
LSRETVAMLWPSAGMRSSIAAIAYGVCASITSIEFIPNSFHTSPATVTATRMASRREKALACMTGSGPAAGVSVS